MTGVNPGSPSVTVQGFYLTGATLVTFNGTPGTIVGTPGETSITVTPPAKSHGTIADVVVTTPGGTSDVTTLDQYTYP